MRPASSRTRRARGPGSPSPSARSVHFSDFDLARDAGWEQAGKPLRLVDHDPPWVGVEETLLVRLHEGQVGWSFEVEQGPVGRHSRTKVLLPHWRGPRTNTAGKLERRRRKRASACRGMIFMTCYFKDILSMSKSIPAGPFCDSPLGIHLRCQLRQQQR